MADVVLKEPGRANLLALVLERLLRRVQGPLPSGSYRLRAGRMSTRIAFEGGRATVSMDDAPADCEIEGSLAVLSGLAMGASPVGAWWRGELRWRGSVFRALRLARLLRCR